VSGKATIPARVHARIRALAKRGMGRRAIAEEMGCSLYTVRKALDPDFAERERERHRSFGPARWEGRKGDPDYLAYQADYAATRLAMAVRRARRR